MTDRQLDVQLDVDTSAGSFGPIVERWIHELSAAVVPQARDHFAGLPAQPPKARRAPGVPFGAISVTVSAGGAYPKTHRRTFSDAGLRWLHGLVKDLPPSETAGSPVRIVAEVSVPDEHDSPATNLFYAKAELVGVSPGWLKLRAYASGLLDPVEGAAGQRRWLDLLHPFADELNPGYGHIAYAYYEGATALERVTDTKVRPPEQWRPDLSLGHCREWLRGYSWLTIVPAELTDRLGGADRMRASGAFAEVRELAKGGLWLRATDDFREFTGDAVERVFEALAPALPPGLPRSLTPRAEDPPLLIVPRDPSRV